MSVGQAGEPGSITQLLSKLSDGDSGALDRLIPIVYDELRSIARARLRAERPGHTLSTTALVHEAYLRLVGLEGTDLNGRAHFFAVCSRTMRQVLMDYADRVNAAKRGGGVPTVALTESLVGDSGTSWEEFLALNRALEELERMDERQCRVVECRFFAGLTIRETADVLDLSDATVKREWGTARAWLNHRLSV